MLYSFVRDESTSQRTQSVKNNCFISHIYCLLAAILFLVVCCVFIWKFVLPTGEFVVITIAAGLAVLWALFGLAGFVLGCMPMKKIFLIGVLILMILLFLAWIFLLVNVILTPCFYDKCHYKKGSESNSSCGGSSNSHVSSKSTCNNEFLECERHYYKKFAWALALLIWLFLDIFILRLAAIHYQLRDYYSAKYSQYAGQESWDKMGCNNGGTNFSGCETPLPQYCNAPPPASVYRQQGECNQPTTNMYRGSCGAIPGSVYSQSIVGIRNIRMSDADSVIVS